MISIITQEELNEEHMKRKNIKKYCPIFGGYIESINEEKISLGQGNDKDIKSKSELIIFVGKDEVHPYPRIKVTKRTGGDKDFSNRSKFYEIYIPTRSKINDLTFAKKTNVRGDAQIKSKDEKEIIKFINNNIDLLWKNSDDFQLYSDAQLKLDIIKRCNEME